MSMLDRGSSFLLRTAREHLPRPVKRRLLRAARKALAAETPSGRAAAGRSGARHGADDALLRSLESGHSLEEALVAEVRALGNA